MRRLLWFLLGIALLGAGITLLLTSRPGPTDFGWFAYTPLDDTADWYMPGDDGTAVIVSQWQIVGAGIAAVGLLVLAGGLGYVMGRRRR